MTAPLTAAKTLGTSGKVFFGGLCVGTFGLGCWQLERLLEKWDAIENRDQQLAMTPIRYDSDRIQSSDGLTTTLTDAEHPYRRRLLRGRFRHDKEVLIGPRGAPPGVRLPVSGLSAKQQSGRGGGNSGSGSGSTTVASGMQPGPQGFYVLTPLEVEPDGTGTGTANANANANSTGVVWVNRGWVPKTVVPGADRSYSRNDLVQKAKLEAELRDTPPAWNRPSGRVELTAVVSQAEKPRFIIPEHDYSKRPLQLFWIDGLALKAIAADLMTTEERERADTPVVTQVVGCDYESESENENEFDAHTTTQAATTTTQQLLYPLQPPVASVGAFKTTPSVHMGYAATWFGLSGAGWYMTRKLITKGRW